MGVSLDLLASAVAVNELDTHYLTRINCGAHHVQVVPLSSWDAVRRVPYPRPSSGLLGSLTLAKSHAWPAAVLVDELNSCFLESGLDFFSGCLSPSKPALCRFQALYRWKGDFSSRR
jgi:hypothetical protein